MGCCPFHEDHTASLSVGGIPDRWHCFGCGAGGDVIDWTMRTTHVGFTEAVALLQQNAVPARLPAPPPPTPAPAAVEPDRAYAINDLAWAHYTRHVAHEHALAWLRSHRGLDLRAAEASAGAPLVGHSGADWTTLTRHLHADGVTDDEILGLDLATHTRTGRLIDTLHDRLLVPVRTPAGQIAGLVGRDTSGDPRAPKYRNSTRTAVYDKQTALYTPVPVRAGATAVVVEGPIDALAIASCNAANAVAVATCGSTVTSAQARRLINLQPDRIVLALDGDPAGHDATLRWVDRVCRASATPAEVADPPAGHDPADLIARHGPAALGRIVEGRRPPGPELVALTAHYARDPVLQLTAVARELLARLPAADVDEHLRLKIGRSTVRPRPWPPPTPLVRQPLTCGFSSPGSLRRGARLPASDRQRPPLAGRCGPRDSCLAAIRSPAATREPA